ncbi:hypothetical protein BDN72DRAFT_342142 [Pluteus cervinus]|uniref:Uncharacterized protein n=1 Tax=Pluteus cervinus TaxID=181527 RepID=A0ACD3B2H4_9AGAR|nr:hypothetical protein BDN72DRAFT_342142 [Pluteus cervinus]
MSSSQPTTLLSLPNELLLQIFRSSSDLEDEFVYLGQTCRRLNSLCIPLYLRRKGIVFRDLVENDETPTSYQTVSEGATFPRIRQRARDRSNTLTIDFSTSRPKKHRKFNALALNFDEIPFRPSSENSSNLQNLSSRGPNTENTSAVPLALHHVDFVFHLPGSLRSLLGFFSRVEYFLCRRHIRTNIVTLCNLQPTGPLEDGSDLSQWLSGLTGLFDAILESGCRTFQIISDGDRTISYYALCQQIFPRSRNVNSHKRVNGVITQMRAAFPKLGFHRQRDHDRSATAPTTSGSARPMEELQERSRFTPLRSPSGSWSYKPSQGQHDPTILAEMSNSAQQACHLTCLIVSTSILIVPPVSNWLFMLLQLPTCPLTKLGFTNIESETNNWEAFFECLEACFLLREKAVNSMSGQIRSPVLKELCVVRCYGIPRGSILKLLSSFNGLGTVKLEVLRLESLGLHPPPKPELCYLHYQEPGLEYPSDPRWTWASISPSSATMNLKVPELFHLTSLTIPSSWAHDFPFQQSSPTHLRTLFIQIDGDITTSEFWLKGGGTKLASILPLYSPSKSVLLGLRIQSNPFLSDRPQGDTVSDAEQSLRAKICPHIYCLHFDGGYVAWTRKLDEMTECMFPNLTHVTVRHPFLKPHERDQKKRVENRLRILFCGCKTLKTVECEGIVYSRESWEEAVELLGTASPAATLT